MQQASVHVALYFCFKKGFHRNLDLITQLDEIFLSKIAVLFLREINRLIEKLVDRLINQISH